MTDYVATRWYRSPEILLGSTRYSSAIDVWAVGCILAELSCGKPILAGCSTMNQIEKIIQLLGMPSEDDVASIKSNFAALMLKKIPPISHLSLSDVCTETKKETLEFVLKCMKFNPSKRLTAKQALKHSYLAIFHDPAKENSCGPIKVSINDPSSEG
jgi:mitogen-activated protein kinase 15